MHLYLPVCKLSLFVFPIWLFLVVLLPFINNLDEHDQFLLLMLVLNQITILFILDLLKRLDKKISKFQENLSFINFLIWKQSYFEHLFPENKVVNFLNAFNEKLIGCVFVRFVQNIQNK